MVIRKLYYFIALIMLSIMCPSCLMNGNEDIIFSGKVTDISGNGISGVSVKFNHASEPQTVQTSSDGSYEALFNNGGTVGIEFSKDNYTPKSFNTAFMEGDSKSLDVILKTIKEESYFSININDASIPSTKGSLKINVNTNVKYEVECAESWIECMKGLAGITVFYSENTTNTERVTTIKFNAEYGYYHEIKITQAASSN